MTTEPAGNPEAILRQSAFPADAGITGQRVPRVFQAFDPILAEAAAALDRAGQLLSGHLAAAARVTA